MTSAPRQGDPVGRAVGDGPPAGRDRGRTPAPPAAPAAPMFAEAALAVARRDAEALDHPACLLDHDLTILHCNAAWDDFAARHGGAGASGAALRGRPYLTCVAPAPVAAQLAGLLRRALAGVAQEVPATCHSAETARLLTARYEPVASEGLVVGVLVAYRPDHVFPLADLYPVRSPDPRAHQDEAGRVELCGRCSRARRRDGAERWELVPDYLREGAPPTAWSLCGACFSELFGLTRG